jgi:hypothetical protein
MYGTQQQYRRRGRVEPEPKYIDMSFHSLQFDVPNVANLGTYTLICQLPPMQNNQPSYIATYYISEP